MRQNGKILQRSVGERDEDESILGSNINFMGNNPGIKSTFQDRYSLFSYFNGSYSQKMAAEQLLIVLM
jgi:hypothetical protein